MSEMHKCMHEPCHCMVRREDVYCSPGCERRADNGFGAPCGCDHTACSNADAQRTSADNPPRREEHEPLWKDRG